MNRVFTIVVPRLQGVLCVVPGTALFLGRFGSVPRMVKPMATKHPIIFGILLVVRSVDMLMRIALTPILGPYRVKRLMEKGNMKYVKPMTWAYTGEWPRGNDME